MLLQLLYMHQHDAWDGPTAPADDAEEPTRDDEDEGTIAEAKHHVQLADEVDGTAAGTTQTQPSSDPAPGEAGVDTHRSLHITRRHLTRIGPGRVPSSMSISAKKPSAQAAASPVSEDVGPVLLGQLHALLGKHCSINLRPVIDLPAGHIPVDSYEIPARLREQLHLRYPADVFPYAATVSRRIDLDHTIRYLGPDQGGPPGQTRIGNLGPHVRRHHRYKTFGHRQLRQPEPGTWLWRSPHSRIYLVNATGTHPLGNTELAHKIWRVATPPHELAS